MSVENISNSSTAQDSRTSRVSASNVIYRGIIIFLLFFIVAVSLLFVGVFKKLSYIPEDVADVVLESLICQNCNTQNEEETEETVLQSNLDWAIYQYPKYGLSVEIPSDIGYNDAFYDEKLNYPYRWKIYGEKNVSTYNEIFSNYLERVSITYSPESVPIEYGGSALGSGGDDSAIYIDFYENESEYTISQISDLFEEYILEYQELHGLDGKDNLDVTTILDREGIEYEYGGFEVKHTGYILLNKKYIVVLESQIYGVDPEHLDRAEKVLESIRFQ